VAGCCRSFRTSNNQIYLFSEAKGKLSMEEIESVNLYFESIFAEVDQQQKNDFLETYKEFENEIPFDIVKFAKRLGIILYSSKSFTDNQSGKIEYDVESKNYSIFVNENHSPNRKFFTLAHEVGHFFCDRDYLGKEHVILEDVRVNTLHRNGENPPKELLTREVRANKFAAEILMPTHKFILAYQDDSDLEKIARKFRVSVDAVRIKASNVLGVIL
jgi:Zn-dependent peptidase ImmA (M78 family)